jgi:hypothetical protein
MFSDRDSTVVRLRYDSPGRAGAVDGARDITPDGVGEELEPRVPACCLELTGRGRIGCVFTSHPGELA